MQTCRNASLPEIDNVHVYHMYMNYPPLHVHLREHVDLLNLFNNLQFVLTISFISYYFTLTAEIFTECIEEIFGYINAFEHLISDNWWQKIWLFIFLIIIIYDDFDRYFTGRTPSIVIADTEILQEILVKQFNNFTDRAVSWAALNSCTGVRKQIIYNYSIEVPESVGVNSSISKIFQ